MCRLPLHAGLFGAVYPWAGTFRTIDIFKEGEPPYADARFLDEQGLKIFRDLKAENNLHGLERSVFVARLATVMGDLHVLHPFREGNTRTLQVATAEIAYRAGHALSWQRADPATIRSAGTAAVFFDFEPYRKILLEICGEPELQTR
jgi:cell filamentation protein